MTTTAKDLRDKRVRLAEAANGILTKAHNDGQELLQPDEEETWDRMHAEIDALERNIAMIEKQEQAGDAARGGRRARDRAERAPERAAGRSLALQRYRRPRQDDAQRALRTWLLAAPTSGYTITGDDRALCDRMGIPVYAKQVELRLSTRPDAGSDGAADAGSTGRSP